MREPIRIELGVPNVGDRSTFHAELDALRIREKAHTREGDAIAAAADGSARKLNCDRNCDSPPTGLRSLTGMPSARAVRTRSVYRRPRRDR
jgi:hypothetical protein